jgi:hypothetical protein
MSPIWTKIYTTSDPIKAELIKQLLEENGIEAVLLNKQDSSYLFGEVQVLVLESNRLQAQQIATNTNFTA